VSAGGLRVQTQGGIPVPIGHALEASSKLSDVQQRIVMGGEAAPEGGSMKPDGAAVGRAAHRPPPAASSGALCRPSPLRREAPPEDAQRGP